MRLRQLIEEFRLEGRIHGVPELLAAGKRSFDVLRCWLSGGRRGELGGNRLRQRGVEGIQTVDGSRNTIEADTLQTDFANELGGLDFGALFLGRSDAVEDRERVGGV